MIAILTLFWKLETVKEMVGPLYKKHRFRTPFDSQHVKGLKLLENVHKRTFSNFFITPREPGLEYTFHSDILNLRAPW